MKTQPESEERPRFIVGEASIAYPMSAGDDVETVRARVEAPMGTISKRFEQVVAVNAERGYRLVSWNLTSVPVMNAVGPVVATSAITETIVAVFEDMRERGAVPLSEVDPPRADIENDADEYWVCKVGPAKRSELPDGSDLPMRLAVREAFERVTGRPDLVCFSGWGAGLTSGEAEVLKQKEAP